MKSRLGRLFRQSPTPAAIGPNELRTILPMVTATPTKPRNRPLPTSTRAAAIDRFGPPTARTLHTLPVPEAGRGELVTAVRAAGLGVWDAEVRDGSLKRLA